MESGDHSSAMVADGAAERLWTGNVKEEMIDKVEMNSEEDCRTETVAHGLLAVE